MDLLPFEMDSRTAITSCKSLGGQTLIPDTKSDNENMLKDFNRKSPKLICQVSPRTSVLLKDKEYVNQMMELSYKPVRH